MKKLKGSETLAYVCLLWKQNLITEIERMAINLSLVKLSPYLDELRLVDKLFVQHN